MAINVYTPGCHLLCHDDVIGSRRISYILYMTDPEVPWKEEWGGALRLYPLEETQDKDGKTTLVPKATHSKSIPPAFNQLSFFAVQPGRSFHDVEEIYSPADGEKTQEDGRVRMAISGWYHIPQEGETGYISGEEESLAKQSSLAQLQGRSDKHDRPQPKITSFAAKESSKRDVKPSTQGDPPLSEQDLDFLLKYIAPTYLTPDTHEEISNIFEEDCCLLLDTFLTHRISERLRDYLERSEAVSEVNELPLSWSMARPPHKHRYLYQHSSSHELESPIQEILTNLFPSSAFRKWLQLVTGQTVTSYDTLARRFRRGLDYTLAQNYENEDPRIEVCLSITPSNGWVGNETTCVDDGDAVSGEGTAVEKKEGEEGEEVDVGGYLVYMAGDNADDEDGSAHNASEVPLDMPTGGRALKARRSKPDPAIYKTQDENEDDNVLFSMPACWNKLGIVLRDKGTLRFVKYVSRQAKGDRWDIFGEYEIDPEDDDKDNGEEVTTIHDDEINDNEESDDDETNDEGDDDDDDDDDDE